MRSTLPVFLLLAGAVACGGAPDEDVADSDDHELIGGQPAAVGRFPSTLHIAAGCTAVKVAPKQVLTAAHCVFDPSALEPLYGPSKPIALSRAPAKGHTEHPVAAVHVHPKWKSACAESYCAASAVTAKLDAPDVAVVELVSDLKEVPAAPIEAAPLAEGERVILLGFGCTTGVHLNDAQTSGTLLFANGKVVPASAALHAGSPVARADMAVYAGNYLLTGGPATTASLSGLCPGDSGGPLFVERGAALAVAGVNANYTLRPDAEDQKGLPVTNWHTRLDDESRNGVAAWLRSIGALSGPSSTSRRP